MEESNYQAGDMVRVRLEGVSFQWFHAIIIEVKKDILIVDTMFHVAGQMRWHVKRENIKSMSKRYTADVKPSSSLKRHIKKVVNHTTKALNQPKKTWHDDL